MPSAELTPKIVLSSDSVRIATYEWGAADSPTVVALHGFASSASANWQVTGWTRDLVRAGFRVIGFDQRGHGQSDKPHSAADYSLSILVGDLLAVLDAYDLADVALLGYSLGARVTWQAALDLSHRVSRAVLGGIPEGDPLVPFRIDQARAFIAGGPAPAERLTATYLSMASRIPGNDLAALVALVEGMRGGTQPDRANPPQQPLLFATGSDDQVIGGSRALAAAARAATLVEIPGRHHFNAPTSAVFRSAAVAFLQAE